MMMRFLRDYPYAPMVLLYLITGCLAYAADILFVHEWFFVLIFAVLSLIAAWAAAFAWALRHWLDG